MELTTFTKMRVDLAAQTLSQSVCSGIRTELVCQSILPNETLYTADFCSFLIYSTFIIVIQSHHLISIEIL